jgi:4-carboxymuconolactone decarboxylase
MNTPDHSALEKLLDSSEDFGTFGRYEETPVAEMSPEMREAFDFTKNLRGLVPGPHKIWLANPKLSKTIVPTGAYFQTASTLSKAEIEIATCVICGQWGAAYSSFEHEKIGVHLGHLEPAKCAALVAGLPTSFDDPREQIVYELSTALAEARVVPQYLYRRAQELLGDAGIVDVTVLMGWFTMVSLTLMAFDVPSNAVGLKQ